MTFLWVPPVQRKACRSFPPGRWAGSSGPAHRSRTSDRANTDDTAHTGNSENTDNTAERTRRSPLRCGPDWS